MLRKFRVPVGLNEEENKQIKDFFSQKSSRKKRLLNKVFGRFSKSDSMDDAAEGYLNDHSRAIYLMAPDGMFLAFYSLDIEDNEL